MSQRCIRAEDDAVTSIVLWAMVAAISAVGSLLFLAGLQACRGAAGMRWGRPLLCNVWSC
jgi:hypothetical protein